MWYWGMYKTYAYIIFQKDGARQIETYHSDCIVSKSVTCQTDGIIKDVLVQVGSFIFLVNFIILDFDPDPNVLFILWPSFLATGGALIDVVVGKLIIRSHDKVKVFDVYQKIKLPTVYEELCAINFIALSISFIL